MIEKSWCIYFYWFIPGFIGRIEKEIDDIILVRYYEGQHYPLKSWNKNYVKRFETIGEAIKEFARLNHESISDVKERALLCFPSQEKEILKII